MEGTIIPDWINYDVIPSLSAESRAALSKVRPHSLGQAARISGVRQSDVAILMVYIEKGRYRSNTVSRETVS
jgi:tRNA uridine 5-carboxymethylaminomethyl modification enzyme